MSVLLADLVKAPLAQAGDLGLAPASVGVHVGGAESLTALDAVSGDVRRGHAEYEAGHVVYEFLDLR